MNSVKYEYEYELQIDAKVVFRQIELLCGFANIVTEVTTFVLLIS